MTERQRELGLGQSRRPIVQCYLDVLGLPFGRRQSARMRDPVPKVQPNCPNSDRFKMNRLEEGALGDPVLASNLVYNLDGRRRHS
jgi:hypothetical protein